MISIINLYFLNSIRWLHYFLCGLLFIVFNLSVIPFAHAQQYSLRDQAEIKYQAQLTVLEYESILNLISNAAISAPILEDAVQASFSDPNTRIFWSQDVPVEDNLAPSSLNASDKVSRKIKEYIREFDKVYVKSEHETVDFYGFELSNLKQSDQLYVRVKYTLQLRGRHKTDPAPYQPQQQVAELRAEKKENRWVTYITRITRYDPAQPVAAAKDDARLNVAITDDGTFTTKLSELKISQLAREQHSGAQAVIIAQSWRDFDERRFNELRSRAERAEAERDYKGALQLWGQALLVKPREAAIEAKLLKLNKSMQQKAALDKRYQSGEYVEAIKAYGQAIAADPNNADLYNGRGKSYEQLNETQSAIRDYSTAIGLDSKFAEALSNRANLYVRLGEPQKALNDYNQIVISYPNAAAYYPERAKIKASLGDVKGAIEDYEAAIKLNPGLAVLHYEKGQLQYKQKETEEAIRSYSAALEQDSLYADAYYARGLAYTEVQNISSAATDFERAKKAGVKQEQAAAIENIGTNYFALGKEAMAKEEYSAGLGHFIKAVLLSPEDENAWILKGDAHYQLQDYENAIQSYTKAISLDKVSAAYYKRGLVYRHLKDYGTAKTDFEKFVPLGWQLVSMAESRAGNPQPAVSMEQVAVEIAESWYMLGHAQLMAEQYNDALSSLDKALDISKDHAPALYARGAAQLGLKSYKKAIRDLEKSIKSGMADNPWLYLALGDSYLALGQTDYAISIYAYIIDSVDKTFDLAYIHRANAHKSKKRYQLALQDLNAAIANNPALRKDATFIAGKGLIELYESKFQEANQSFDQALSLEQNHAWALYGKASVLASQNKMEESLDLYRRAFQTGEIEWSAIKDDPIIKHVSKQKAFKELVESSLRM